MINNHQHAQDNIKKMLEKADKLGRHGVSTGTIKSFFNAHTDDQYQAAMKQLDGNIINCINCILTLRVATIYF